LLACVLHVVTTMRLLTVRSAFVCVCIVIGRSIVTLLRVAALSSYEAITAERSFASTPVTIGARVAIVVVAIIALFNSSSYKSIATYGQLTVAPHTIRAAIGIIVVAIVAGLVVSWISHSVATERVPAIPSTCIWCSVAIREPIVAFFASGLVHVPVSTLNRCAIAVTGCRICRAGIAFFRMIWVRTGASDYMIRIKMAIAAHCESTVTVACIGILGSQRKQSDRVAFLVERAAWPVIVYDSVSARFVRLAICAAAIIWSHVSIIANFSYVLFYNPISANFGLYVAVWAASVIGARVAIIAGFSCCHIYDAVSACFVRHAIGAAAVSILGVAIIADLAWVSMHIATATDVDAGRFSGRALLAFLAAQPPLFAEVGLCVEDTRSAHRTCDDRHGHGDTNSTDSNRVFLAELMHGSSPAQWLTVTSTPSMSADTTGTMATPVALGGVPSCSVRWGRFRYTSTTPAASAAPPAM